MGAWLFSKLHGIDDPSSKGSYYLWRLQACVAVSIAKLFVDIVLGYYYCFIVAVTSWSHHGMPDLVIDE